MNVTFHNVHHGEYITLSELYTSDNAPLYVIRDFGAYSAEFTPFLKKQAQTIVNDNQLKDVILSHAHEDHFKGFVEMHKIIYKNNVRHNAQPFRYAYIPYLRYQDISDLGFQMLMVGLYYIYIFPKSSTRSEKVKNWILMTPIMYDLSSTLIGVQRGCSFNNWKNKSEVLWPPQKNDASYSSMLQEMQKQLSVFENELDNQTIEHIKLIHKELCDKMEELVTNQRNGSLALPTVKSIMDKCGQMQHGRQRQQSLLNGFNRFNDTIDNHSIVFSVYSDDEKKKALFLSDLDGPSMDQMIVLNKKDHYKLIKSAHHGTRLGNVFSHNVSAETIVHCCGFGNSRYNGPTSDYLNVSNNIYCSDWIYNNSKWESVNSYTLFNESSHSENL